VSPSSHRKQVWAAVFDGGRAFLYRIAHAGETGPGLDPVDAMSHDDAPSRELDRDKPGRTRTPAGGRAAMEPDDSHQRAEDAFVRRFAEETARRGAAGHFDSLIVLAPAETARLFRETLGPEAARISAERHGDFVNHPKLELEKAIAEAREQARFDG
jgi:protein required for attachment to host cells